MVRCSAITSSIYRLHDLPGHPECQDRLTNALAGIPSSIVPATAPPVGEGDAEEVHTPAYLRWLSRRCATTIDTAFIDADTYITQNSYEVALQAAGDAIAAVRRSMEGEHCFAFVRPPGHHAEPDRAMGFCLINNAAIAAACALRSVERVAIVDWDLHHGNGTQCAFIGSNRVMYCSIHQEYLYPCSGWIDDIGCGQGRGYTINAPIREGSGIGDYCAIFTEVFAPALRRFRPDAILVSAGQDILADDPIGGMSLAPADVGTLTGIIREAAGIPLALILEGGYGPSVGAAVSAIFEDLAGNRPAQIPECRPHVSTIGTISTLKKIHGLP
jgi:acetoin utilization deacetylase AcuC-like enzyme